MIPFDKYYQTNIWETEGHELIFLTYIRLMGTKLLQKFLFAVLPVQNLCGVVPVQVLVVQEKILGQHIVRHQREGKPVMTPCLAYLTKGS